MKIIDVREFEEFDKIPPREESLCLPMSRFETWCDVLDKDLEYKIICHTNNRSKEVALWLRENGYNATHISNGMSQLTGDDDCEACSLFKRK